MTAPSFWAIFSGMATPTILKRIIDGEVPCHKIYEDAHVLAILDIQPLSRGHALVIPKETAPTLDQLSDDASAALGRVLPRLCRALMAATGVREYNVLQNNGAGAHQAIFHVHFHIIPKPSPGSGLGIEWPAGHLNPDDAKRLAVEIAGGLAREA